MHGTKICLTNESDELLNNETCLKQDSYLNSELFPLLSHMRIFIFF